MSLNLWCVHCDSPFAVHRLVKRDGESFCPECGRLYSWKAGGEE